MFLLLFKVFHLFSLFKKCIIKKNRLVVSHPIKHVVKLGMFSRLIRYISWMTFKHLNYLQNMAFKIINNLRIFMTVQHVFSNLHQFTSQKDDLHIRTSMCSLLSFVSKLVIWARNSCLDCCGMLNKPDKQDANKEVC